MNLREKNYLCTLYSGQFTVDIFSPSALAYDSLAHDNEAYAPFIPGYKCKRVNPSSDFQIIHDLANEITFSVNAKQNRMSISCPESFVEGGRLLAYLAVVLFEVQRQTCGMMMAHAAAVAKDSKAVLLLGERGDGKTSVAIGLCQKHGYKLLSNDITIIGYDSGILQVHDGTRVIGLRYAAIREKYPELIRLFKDDLRSKNSWTNKVFVTANTVGINIEEGTHECTNVILVHLDCKGTDELSIEEYTGSRPQLMLYENFSRNIRTVSLPLIGGNSFGHLGYMPSFDCIEFHNKRVALINHIFEEMKLLYVSGGNLTEICQAVHEIHGGEYEYHNKY